jgi:hypothetical protein
VVDNQDGGLDLAKLLKDVSQRKRRLPTSTA